MKVGRTISEKRERVVTDSERMAMREKEKRRKKTSAIFFFVGLIVAVVSIFAVVNGIAEQRKRDEIKPAEEKTYTPSVAIENDDGSKYATDRMKTYVGKIEQDFSELGYKVVRVVVPAGKTRELDIYLNGRTEYYKCYLDRDTAETAEDAVRMIKYLDSNNIKPGYVDVRIAGRAYYK